MCEFLTLVTWIKLNHDGLMTDQPSHILDIQFRKNEFTIPVLLRLLWRKLKDEITTTFSSYNV